MTTQQAIELLKEMNHAESEGIINLIQTQEKEIEHFKRTTCDLSELDAAVFVANNLNKDLATIKGHMRTIIGTFTDFGPQGNINENDVVRSQWWNRGQLQKIIEIIEKPL